MSSKMRVLGFFRLMHFTLTGARKIVSYTGISVPKGALYLYGEYLKAVEASNVIKVLSAITFDPKCTCRKFWP